MLTLCSEVSSGSNLCSGQRPSCCNSRWYSVKMASPHLVVRPSQSLLGQVYINTKISEIHSLLTMLTQLYEQYETSTSTVCVITVPSTALFSSVSRCVPMCAFFRICAVLYSNEVEILKKFFLYFTVFIVLYNFSL